MSSDDSSEEIRDGIRIQIELDDQWNIGLVKENFLLQVTFLSLAGSLSTDGSQVGKRSR